MRRWQLAPALDLTVILCSCTPWATYPPIEGAAALGDPTLEPIPTLMAEAIRYVYDRDDSEPHEVAINLPPNIPARVYDQVITRLGGGRPMLGPDVNAYHIHAVRLRALEAEVDVIYPGGAGVPEFMTLSFKQDLLKGWYVNRARKWRFRVEVPEPNYVSPGPPTTRPASESEPMDGAEMGLEPSTESQEEGEADAVTRPT